MTCPARPVSCLLLALTLLPIETAAQAVVIPVKDRRDHVYDSVRDRLYISTNDGKVVGWDPYSRELLPALDVGKELYGIDLTPDDKVLYCAEAVFGATEGFIHKVDLDTRKVTTLRFPLDRNEGATWDICVSGNGKAFFSTDYRGSGFTPLREIDLKTDTIRKRSSPSSLAERSLLARSHDHQFVSLIEASISSGTLYLYDPLLDTFAKSIRPGGFPFDGSVDRNGKLFSQQMFNELRVFDDTPKLIRSFRAYPGGHVFAPDRDLLYAVDPLVGEVHALDTQTWQVVRRFPIGARWSRSLLFSTGRMSISDDGAFLFVSTETDVRMLQVGPPKPQITEVEPGVRPHDAQPVEVRVLGAALSGAGTPEVWFGPNSASRVRVISDSELRCVIPPGEPGPVDVRVKNARGERTLKEGFRYSPAVILRGDKAVGGSVLARVAVTPGSQVLVLVGVPPPISVPTPPFYGRLCIRDPLPLFVSAWWPFDDVPLDVKIPDEPRLRGQRILFQSLAGGILAGKAAWSNCAELEIR